MADENIIAAVQPPQESIQNEADRLAVPHYNRTWEAAVGGMEAKLRELGLLRDTLESYEAKKIAFIKKEIQALEDMVRILREHMF